MADPFIGEIRLFGGNFAPVNWAVCSGAILPISQNDTLFALLGTTYGGDGQTTFGLPDLRGRVPVHQGTMPDGDNYVLGQLAGVESVTLADTQVGPHTHPVAAGGAASQPNPEGNLLGATPGGSPRYLPAGSGGLLPLDPRTVAYAGGRQPHENMMPYLAVTFIIALLGVYPSPS